MSEPIQAYPLQWPAGWRRTSSGDRVKAQFSKRVPQYRDVLENGFAKRVHSYDRKTELTVAEGLSRVLEELARMGMDRSDVVISTNVEVRLDGLPYSNRRSPSDPGVAVYWGWRRAGGREARCMAVDRYDRVADNLAAIAATLEAMRAIERHGGATILDRAFQGFTALPAPESWWQTLGLTGPNASREEIEHAHSRLIMKHHPDRGGDTEKASQINRARDLGLATLS